MKKKIFGLAFCLAVSMMATPALAVNCGNVESAPASAVDYSISAEEMPMEEPTVDWDTARLIGYDFRVVDEDSVEPIPEPHGIVDLAQYQDGKIICTVNGVEMVPLRLVAENMGYTVDWNEETQSATINGGEMTYTVRIGEDTVVDNVTGNIIYDVVDTVGEDGQADTAVYTINAAADVVYTPADGEEKAADVAYDPADGEEKIDDENCGVYADGAEYSAYEVNTADGGICGVSELAICPAAYTIGGYGDEAAPESKLVAAQPANGFGAKAQLIDGKTFVPAAMFRVLNYNYDQAGKTFTLGKLNVQEAGTANGVGQYVITLAD